MDRHNRQIDGYIVVSGPDPNVPGHDIETEAGCYLLVTIVSALE